MCLFNPNFSAPKPPPPPKVAKDELEPVKQKKGALASSPGGPFELRIPRPSGSTLKR